MLRRTQILFLLSFSLVVFAVGCGSTSNGLGSSAVAAPKPTPAVWATSWGNAPENALQTDTNPGGSEQSFRMIFRPTLSGTQERLHSRTSLAQARLRLALHVWL